MEGKTKFSRRLQQSEGLTDLDPRLLFYDYLRHCMSLFYIRQRGYLFAFVCLSAG